MTSGLAGPNRDGQFIEEIPDRGWIVGTVRPTRHVANTNDDKVTVIDVATRAVVTTFAPGKEPDGMGWARK